MSIEASGVVEAVRRDKKGFKLVDGDWYSGRQHLSVNKGDTVSFTYKQNGDFRNLDGGVTVTGGAPAQQSGGGSAAPRVSDDARQRMIVRQNALTNAVAFVLGSVGQEAIDTDAVISVAQDFEYYTSGDLAKQGKAGFTPEE